MSITLDGTTGITAPSVTGTPVIGGLVSGTAVASTSGTTIDFTGIPSWAKRITVMFSGVSTNGTSIVQVQLGSGSVTTTGYQCNASYSAANAGQYAYATSGFILEPTGLASAVASRSGNITLSLFGSNAWVGNGSIGMGATTLTSSSFGGVSPALSGALDRVRITTVNGTDAFDAGTINIMYEG